MSIKNRLIALVICVTLFCTYVPVIAADNLVSANRVVSNIELFLIMQKMQLMHCLVQKS